jgi:hypothetical protein
MQCFRMQIILIISSILIMTNTIYARIAVVVLYEDLSLLDTLLH